MYDPEFSEAVKATKPNWFKANLAGAMSKYRTTNSVRDPEFDDAVKATKPNWLSESK